jgi:hypothetical protein
MKDHRLPLLGLLSFLLAAIPATAGADDALGPAVLTRAHGDALAIWDATADLTAIIATNPSAEVTLQRLEADTFTVLVTKSKALKADAKTLSVSTIYRRSGAISPQYQTATFLGVEKLLTLEANVEAAQANEPAWTEQLRAGKIPGGVTVTVTGKLPPELK